MDSNFTFLEMINNAENFNEGDTVTTSGYFNKDDGYGFTYSVSRIRKHLELRSAKIIMRFRFLLMIRQKQEFLSNVSAL